MSPEFEGAQERRGRLVGIISRVKQLGRRGFGGGTSALVASLVMFGVPGTSVARSSGIACGTSAAPVDRPVPYLTAALPLGDVFWLGIYPFRSGYPTKVLVVPQQRAMTQRVVVRGRQCTTGKRLRFWYRERGEPFVRLPVSAVKLRTTGTLSATFGPWVAGGTPAAGGFFDFW